MASIALTILIAAAVAYSAVEFVSGPLLLRAVFNRIAVLKWLLAGLAGWQATSIRSKPPRKGARAWRRSLRLVQSRLQRDLRKYVFVADRLAGVERRLRRALDRALFIPLESAFADGGSFAPAAATLKLPFRTSLEEELVRLATGGHKAALYRLEGDQLAAQINAAAEAALDRPRRHRLLVVALATLSRGELRTPGDMSPLKEFLVKDSTLGKVESTSDLMAQRHELALRIQRRLDDLQITTRSYQQIASQFLYVVVAGIVVSRLDRSIASDELFALAMMGGFVAPLLGRVLRRP